MSVSLLFPLQALFPGEAVSKNRLVVTSTFASTRVVGYTSASSEKKTTLAKFAKEVAGRVARCVCLFVIVGSQGITATGRQDQLASATKNLIVQG